MYVCRFLQQLFNLDALLLRRIAIAYRYSAVAFDRVKVNHYGVWRTNFVLAAVAFTDITVVIPHDIAMRFLQRFVYFAGFFYQNRLVF